MPVIIDGNNLLWAVHEVGDDSEQTDRLRLCCIVGRYLKLAGETGQIVFDGAGPPDKTAFDNITSLEVFFAGLSAEADEVIEDKIKASTAPRRLTVVSSDRRLRAAARARKAGAVKSETFWNQLRTMFTRGRTDKEPAAKRWGLSEIETEQWLRFFGIEQ
ncbi:MAG: NYN domain-containing protein [Planctomycetota bacterium]|jgi:predicted RNA-binding protein with PIN domain